MKVLVYERIPGETLWFAVGEAKLIAETPQTAIVRRHWWSRRKAYPKNGPFMRISRLAKPTEEPR